MGYKSPIFYLIWKASYEKYIFFFIFAFGDILFFSSKKKDAKNAVPQVPGGLIFRKYPQRVHNYSVACKITAFTTFEVKRISAENRDQLT